MGWNDWYTHYNRITDELMRKAADTMVDSGMADFGYEYVNIDDCWMMKPGAKEPELAGESRTPAGVIRPNGRFPNMNALTDYIHAKGLKAGIYTSPEPLTCGKFEGSFRHERADAQQFAEWGFDFLKYDWCSYGKVAGGKDLQHFKAPYQLMGAILPGLERDVVFNLCQYGMGDVWNWGAAAGGHCWRTTGDLGLEKNTRLAGFYSIAFKNAQHAANAGPGRWNDPDYILIGTYGDAQGMGHPQKTKLAANEVAAVDNPPSPSKGVNPDTDLSSLGSFAPVSSTTVNFPSVRIMSPVAFEAFRGAAGRSTSAYAVPVPMKSRSVSTQSRSRSMCGSMRCDHFV